MKILWPWYELRTVWESRTERLSPRELSKLRRKEGRGNVPWMLMDEWDELGKEGRIKGWSFREDHVPRNVIGGATGVREDPNLCPHKPNQIECVESTLTAARRWSHIGESFDYHSKHQIIFSSNRSSQEQDLLASLPSGTPRTRMVLLRGREW